jgi:hypothetical protein
MRKRSLSIRTQIKMGKKRLLEFPRAGGDVCVTCRKKIRGEATFNTCCLCEISICGRCPQYEMKAHPEGEKCRLFTTAADMHVACRSCFHGRKTKRVKVMEEEVKDVNRSVSIGNTVMHITY